MAARRHMHQYGTTSEQLAEIAVVTRRHAGLNPLAMYREPITVQDVLNSRMIADPLHLLDCCVVSDGGGAVMVTTEERARDLRQMPVYVLGSSEGHTHAQISQMPDLTVTAAAMTGPRAFAEAGVRPDDGFGELEDALSMQDKL
jgi:acetyl-CoA acetyltransferase